MKVKPCLPNKGSFKKGHKTWNKGIPLSEITKHKISIANKGHVAWNKGIPTREETKEKFRHPHRPDTILKIKAARKLQIITPEHRKNISDSLKGKPKSQEHIEKISGKNNYRWKGGSKRVFRKSWWTIRKQVLERDSFRCQTCGESSVKKLIVHHIIHHDQGGLDAIENLVTWCRACHVRYHTPKLIHTANQSNG